MKYRCQKCKKRFTSEYLLNKHLNKTISCDIVLKCDKCEKKFDTIFLLNRHLLRKTPCISTTIENNSNNILLKIEEVKLDQEREKTRQEEEKTRRELEKLKLKEEIQIKKIELQKQKNLEIEQAKTDRKEKTASIINNINNQNIKIEVTNHINNIFDAKIVLNSDKFKTKDISHLFDVIKNPKIMEQLCKDNNSLTDLLANIMKITYNNDNVPEARYIISDKDSEHFLVADEQTGEYKIVEYNEIEKYLKKTTNMSYVEIKKVIDKKVLPKSKAEEFRLYENMYINGNYTLKQPALIGLDPNNRILKSENKRVRKKESNKYGGAYSSSEDEDEYD